MLAIVWHSRTGASEALAAAAAEGGRAADPGVAVALLSAQETTAEALLGASGYIFACPENLGTMSGAMKEMFDRCYYPLLGRVEGRPYATLVAAGSDGTGAQAQLDRIVSGWRLRRVADPFIINLEAQTPEAILSLKIVPQSALSAAHEMGQAMSTALALGVF